MAARFYAPGPSTEELEAIGLKPEDVVDDSLVEVWEEHWACFLIFTRLKTQWRVGMSGPTGMDYSLLPTLLDTFSVKQRDRGRVLESLLVMEDEALRIMSARG